MRRRNGPVLVEPYAGSAAVSMRALGQMPLCAYQGGKRGYAVEILRWLNIDRPPAELHLADVGGWYYVWRAIEVHGWACLLGPLERLYCGETDEQIKPVFQAREREIKAWGVVELDASDVVERAALFLWVLRRSFGNMIGKGYRSRSSRGKGNWWSGDDPVRKLGWMSSAGLPRVHAYPGAELIPPSRGRVVYIDPPYPGTTGYRGAAGHAVEDFRAVALAHQRAGSAVAVSLDRPVGIHARPLTFSGAGGRARSKQQAEWLTLYPQVCP